MVDLMTGIVGEVNEIKLSFVKAGIQVGCFWHDEKTGKFRFEGNVDKSAEMFVVRILEQLEKIEASK